MTSVSITQVVKKQHPRFTATKIFGTSAGFRQKQDVVKPFSNVNILSSHLLISGGASARVLSRASTEKTSPVHA